MHEIDKERFGAFLARLRKEQGMTQAAETILAGVADFNAGNTKLAAALDLIKNPQ